ncbi:ATP-grasp domain protein, partial [Vibrio parahaemolyticus AQ3810]
WPR